MGLAISLVASVKEKVHMVLFDLTKTSQYPFSKHLMTVALKY